MRLGEKSFDRLYYAGAIAFKGAVDVPVSNEQDVEVDAPFQFDGFLRGSVYSQMSPDPDTPIFSWLVAALLT